jgi:hypothetical protein
MNNSIFPNSTLNIRPVKFRDLEAIANLLEESNSEERKATKEFLYQQIKKFQSFYGLLQLCQLFPHSINNEFFIYVGEQNNNLKGLIQVSPNNKNRSTWRVEQVIINQNLPANQLLIGSTNIGSQLLRHCFEKIWEARTWVLEVNVNEKESLGLYRQNGFQPLAQLTYWCCPLSLLQQLAENEPDLPNLLPISNSDARLLYQLDCVSMPPLLRQVFDRHIEDFKTGLITYLTEQINQWLNKKEVVSGYVFEPQRKAAIGYFKLELSLDGTHAHQAKLTVHPAYTWLYPKLLNQMAVIIQRVAPQSLQLSSADYQPEREQYLEKLGAKRIEHTLLMSRSVWHKLKESKPLEALNLPEVLQGLQPARNPIPTPWVKSMLAQSFPSLLHQDKLNSSLSKSKKSSDKNKNE